MEKAKVLVAMDKLSAIEEFAKELREFLTPLAADPPLVEPVFEDKSPTPSTQKEEKVVEKVEEASLDEIIEEFGLNEMDEDELKEELKAVGIEFPPRAKKDKLVQLVAQAVADGKIGAEDEEEPEETPVAEEPAEKVEAVLETAEEIAEEEEDELSEEEINAMSYEELESLCKENEIDIPEEVTSVKTKAKKQKALAEYVISLISEEEEANEVANNECVA